MSVRMHRWWARSFTTSAWVSVLLSVVVFATLIFWFEYQEEDSHFGGSGVAP